VVSVIAVVSKVRGFRPGLGLWISKDDTSPQHAFLQRGSEAVGPMS
jgi:hypothetical protein